MTVTMRIKEAYIYVPFCADEQLPGRRLTILHKERYTRSIIK